MALCSISIIPIAPYTRLFRHLPPPPLSLCRSNAADSYASSRLLVATRVHFTPVPVYQPLPTCHISDCPMWSLSRETARRAGHRYTTWRKNKELHAITCVVQTTYLKFIPQIFFFFVYIGGNEQASLNISSRVSRY